MYLNRFKFEGMSSSAMFLSILISAAMAPVAALDHTDSIRERLKGVSYSSYRLVETLQ